MEVKRVGSRGTLFTFDDLGIATNIYVIHGKQHVFILDTYLGPEVMQPISEYIKSELGEKQVIVVNSHGHWDHVWGNCLYSQHIIIGHELSKKYMKKNGEQELNKFEQYTRGNVVLTYPNLTFTDRLYFEEDEVLIYHTPGHTEDEISIVDLKDKVLFAGDNLERPIPYIFWTDLSRYIKTLEEYLKLDAQIIIGGHTACESKNLIHHNLNYIKKVLAGDTEEFKKDEYADYHKSNMEWLSSHKR